MIGEREEQIRRLFIEYLAIMPDGMNGNQKAAIALELVKLTIDEQLTDEEKAAILNRFKMRSIGPRSVLASDPFDKPPGSIK